MLGKLGPSQWKWSIFTEYVKKSLDELLWEKPEVRVTTGNVRDTGTEPASVQTSGTPVLELLGYPLLLAVDISKINMRDRQDTWEKKQYILSIFGISERKTEMKA